MTNTKSSTLGPKDLEGMDVSQYAVSWYQAYVVNKLEGMEGFGEQHTAFSDLTKLPLPLAKEVSFKLAHTMFNCEIIQKSYKNRLVGTPNDCDEGGT